MKKYREVKAECVKQGATNAELKQVIFDDSKVPFTFFESARWGADITLDKPPGPLERAFWITDFYKLVADPQLQVAGSRLTNLMLYGIVTVILLEAGASYSAGTVSLLS